MGCGADRVLRGGLDRAWRYWSCPNNADPGYVGAIWGVYVVLVGHLERYLTLIWGREAVLDRKRSFCRPPKALLGSLEAF